MTNYEILLFCEKNNFEIEIYDKKLNSFGCCGSVGNNKVMVFVGRDTGEDDRKVSIEDFNKNFKITNIIR